MKRTMLYLFPALAILAFFSCQKKKYEEPTKKYADEKVNKLVDDCWAAMGGYQNYAAIRHIKWDFFGNRQLLWDKKTGRVRIEVINSKRVLLTNTNDWASCKAFENGAAFPDSMAVEVQKRARNIWINDSYWLVMPFKLKDEGVKLKLIGNGADSLGNACDLVEMTFDGVGVTPDNKYHLYFDKKTHLVVQWDYFAKYDETKPSMSTLWTGYKETAGVLFSEQRSDKKLSGIEAFDSLDNSIYLKETLLDWGTVKNIPLK